MLSDLCRQIFFSHMRYLPTYLSLLSLKSHLHFCLFLSLKQLRVAICKIEVEISFKPCNYRFLSIDETFISVRLTSQSYGLNSLVFQEKLNTVLYPLSWTRSQPVRISGRSGFSDWIFTGKGMDVRFPTVNIARFLCRQVQGLYIEKASYQNNVRRTDKIDYLIIARVKIHPDITSWSISSDGIDNSLLVKPLYNSD